MRAECVPEVTTAAPTAAGVAPCSPGLFSSAATSSTSMACGPCAPAGTQQRPRPTEAAPKTQQRGVPLENAQRTGAQGVPSGCALGSAGPRASAASLPEGGDRRNGIEDRTRRRGSGLRGGFGGGGLRRSGKGKGGKGEGKGWLLPASEGEPGRSAGLSGGGQGKGSVGS